MSEHPDRQSLERFMLGTANRQESREIIRHLITGCTECRAVTPLEWEAEADDEGAELAWRLEGSEEEGLSDYDSVLDRVFCRAEATDDLLARERSVAAELLPNLLRHPLKRQLLLVENVDRYSIWGVCELLLDHGWQIRSDQPARSEELAQVAVAVAERLSPRQYPRDLLFDLRARSWAQLGNARRILSDLRGAEQAFGVAEKRLGSGSSDPMELARLLDLKASLRNAQGSYEEAHQLLDQAIQIFSQLGQHHFVGKALINKSVVCTYEGRAEDSIDLVQRGLDLIDPSLEPRLVLVARHSLIYSLYLTGRYREAVMQLVRSRPMYFELGDRTSLIRLQWLEGKLALELNRFEQAEGALKQVREVFIEDGTSYDVALVSLDLANLYLRQGRMAEVKRVAAETMPLFQSLELRREAMAALVMFSKAVDSEQLTAALIGEVFTAVQESTQSSGLHHRTTI